MHHVGSWPALEILRRDWRTRDCTLWLAESRLCRRGVWASRRSLRLGDHLSGPRRAASVRNRFGADRSRLDPHPWRVFDAVHVAAGKSVLNQES